ncbi:hypothetical protein VPH35_116895 [Triticum aestivum]
MDLRFLSYHYVPLKVIGLASMSSFTKTRQFVFDLARLNHENIAKFLGYCRESDPFSRMIVFGGEAAQFSWLKRMKIAIGIAQGLRYLHTELQPPFAISELNSNSAYVIEILPKVITWLFSPLATQQESSNMHVGVGMQISEASLHKAMVNVPTQGSSSVFVR